MNTGISDFDTTKVVRPAILSKFLDTYFCRIPDILRKALIFNSIIFATWKDFFGLTCIMLALALYQPPES